MKTPALHARGIADLVAVNLDRFLVPLVILGALAISGSLLNYATVH